MKEHRVYTIAPHFPFLPTLAQNILDGRLLSGWAPDQTFALADLTIIVPTRRARLTLSAILTDRSGGARLLPDIRTFGGDPADEEPFLPPFDAPAELPVISPTARTLLLARLIGKWIEAAPQTPFSTAGIDGSVHGPADAEILALAQSLGTLIDDCEIETVSLASLKAIVPENLTTNWQQTLDFLNVALLAWPQILEERGMQDATRARNAQLRRRAAETAGLYKDRPVIAAGSTGSIPATAELLAAISALPRGALVLPGFDTSLTPDGLAALGNQAISPHGHPQYGLASLVRQLGSPVQVTELTPTVASAEGVKKSPSIRRTILVRDALALVADTANWYSSRKDLSDQDCTEAFSPVSIIAAPRQDLEARAVALVARDALAGGQSVGIITPDRNLARRIAAELRRFDIEADDSAGTPLFHTPFARLLRQLLTLVRNDFAAVDLIALLRHQSVRLGRDRTNLTSLADRIERALLRGQRIGTGIAGLRQAISDNLDKTMRHTALKLDPENAAEIDALLTTLESAAAPLATLLVTNSFTAHELATALEQTGSAVLDPADGAPSSSLPGADLFAEWMQTLPESDTAGFRISARGVEQTLEILMAGHTLRAPAPIRDDIFIWGQLEARLQSEDVTIVAGLNEGIWPPAADPGPWLNRTMRIAAGLQPPERQHGQAAHDFAEALGNKDIVLSYSERIGTSPAAPSRLLQRLQTYLGPTIAEPIYARGARYTKAVLQMDAADTPKPAERPTPSPKADIRPRALSVTEAETLIRSPYDLYAKYVLRLRPLAALGANPDHADRGSLIHAIFGDFVQEGHDPLAPGAQARLLQMADQQFAAFHLPEARRTLWRHRFTATAAQFLEFERQRAAHVAERFAERKGQLELPVSGTKIALRGRADRLDRKSDDQFEIIDFKTGGVPSTADMRNLVAPQLLLEAYMLQQGGFDGIPATTVAALNYVKISVGAGESEQKPFALPEGMDLQAAISAFMQGLQARIEYFFLRDDTVMPAQLLPKSAKTYAGDYDHLARLQEWAVAGDEEDGE